MSADDDLIDFEEVACHLAGFTAETIGDGEFEHYETARLMLAKWKHKVMSAIASGDLVPASPPTYVNTRLGWSRLLLDHEVPSYEPADHEIQARFKRDEVTRWLKEANMKPEDIPEGLRSEPQESPAAAVNGEELRALEALGLLAETVAKQAPKYQRNGKPNKAQIAEAMSQQAGEVYGMSKSKLQRLLSYALDAWEEKRG